MDCSLTKLVKTMFYVNTFITLKNFFLLCYLTAGLIETIMKKIMKTKRPHLNHYPYWIVKIQFPS